MFSVVRDSECSECGAEIWKNDFLLMEASQPLCLPCANMGDLEYLPSGDAALTRRATKYSARAAVVVRFSRSRGRYERQGILVEPAALQKAEEECVADADERARARETARAARTKQDREFVAELTARILELYPHCPEKEACVIAEHTAVRGSGRVGRSAAGRALKAESVAVAVKAAVRHRRTNYDDLLARGVERQEARGEVRSKVEEILSTWSGVA